MLSSPHPANLRCPDILAYLALLGRGKHCLRACPTRDEVEAGRAYLASEYARGVGHFVDPTKVPGRTMALPYAGIRIPSPIAQAARPGVDNRVAPWTGLLHREELAMMVSRFHEEALDTLPSYLQELAPDLFPRPVHPQPDKHEGYPFRAAMIAVSRSGFSTRPAVLTLDKHPCSTAIWRCLSFVGCPKVESSHLGSQVSQNCCRGISPDCTSGLACLPESLLVVLCCRWQSSTQAQVRSKGVTRRVLGLLHIRCSGIPH